MTVGDLRELLKDEPDDKLIAVAATPSVNGWINEPLFVKGESDETPHLLLALAEDTILPEEISIVWRNEDGEEIDLG